MLTLNLLALVEVHVGQVRAILEHLDVAWCVRGAESATAHGKRSGTFCKSADWCAKKSSGNFIRCVLTLNLLAVSEAHAGQVRAALEHLNVACSYVVRLCCRQFDSA